MAFSNNFHFCLILIISLFSVSFSQKTNSFRPKALVIPVTKDTSTRVPQYTTVLRQRTPLVPLKLTVDLGGDFLWVNCAGYISSTYKPARCRSAQCSLSGSKACSDCSDGKPRPGCNKNTCSVIPYNPFVRTSTSGELASDVLSVASTNGSNPGRVVTAKNILFACGSNFDGLPRGVQGIAGLGRKRIGLPSQLAAAFSFRRKFAVCLARTTGVIFFGDSPYVFLPNIDVSARLTRTPLILNPVSTAGAFFQGDTSSDYFIGVKSIMVNQVPVGKFNPALLTINKTTGVGGTKISTVEPYLSMQTSIYKAVVGAFVNSISEVPRVKAVPPFAACYASSSLGSTRLGPAVPQIDLVLQSQDVVWSIFGANSMVDVGNDVLCLGVVDGGESPMTSIVIGSHVIEDNLLQFDLASSTLGFSSILYGRQTTCANFNFTSTA